MSNLWVFGTYAGAVILALLLLYVFRARAWYWHAISLLLAMVVGLMPPPEQLQGKQGDLIVGGTFVFLLLWAIAAPFFRKRRPPGQEPAGSA